MKPQILLIEDSTTQAVQIEHQLSSRGYLVEHVASVEQALVFLTQKLPDLIITDYRLFGQTGDVLCSQVRMNVATRHIPILMLTGTEDCLIEQKALNAGADAYVSKKEDIEILLLHIQVLLRRRQATNALLQPDLRVFENSQLLIVDDSPTYLAFLSAELEERGFSVVAVANAEKALEYAANHELDGIIVDLVLPGMNGIELCRELISIAQSREEPFIILALTGSGVRENISAVIEAGADDMLDKSRDMQVICARLRALLRRRYLFRETQRIAKEFAKGEKELAKALSEKEAAEQRGQLADQLAKANNELKQTQSMLVQSAKMAAVGQLTAGIAHEMNNPLAFVLAHLDTLDDCVSILAKEQQIISPLAQKKLSKMQLRLPQIREGASRVKELIVKLKTFSRLDEGELKRVDLVESINSVLTLLEPKLKSHQVNFKFDKIPLVECYAGPLNQVIMNVITNAADAMEPAGGIISVELTKNSSMIEISVADSGCGMEQATMERLFEPFYTTKDVGKGTGLGLSISYGIMQRHRGSIHYDSEPGKGTMATIKLPLSQCVD